MIRKWFEIGSNLCIITMNGGAITMVQIEEGQYSFFFEITSGKIVEIAFRNHNSPSVKPLPEERKSVTALAAQILRDEFHERIATATTYKPDGSLSKFREGK